MNRQGETGTMKDRVRFGLIGAGRIAHAYVEAFGASETASLVAVADVELEAADALAARVGCRAFYSYAALAETAALDAVIVCTPPATHREVALHFLRRRVHVLCEKPLCVNRAGALAMVEAARESGALLTMASKFRFVDDVARARSLVTSGTVGEVVLVENAFTSHVPMRGRWNSDPAVSGGGVLIDNGTHSLDLLRHFLGPLAFVQVVEGRRSQGLEVEETVRVFVSSFDGVMGSIDLSWSIDKELPWFLRIYGSEGTVSVGWKESSYRLAGSREWVTFGSGYDKVGAFRGQLDNFARAIRGEEAPVVTPEDALASVECVEAAYAALDASRWTAVEPTLLAGEFDAGRPTEVRGVA